MPEKTDAEWREFCRPFVFLNGSHEFPNYGAICRSVWQASREHALTEAAALCVSSDGRDYGMTGRNCADQITKLRDEA